jgi:hypothetical protein
MKKNFKKMVQNSKSSNSDKNCDSDCCKEFKEYYVTKEKCDWISEKWLHETAQLSSKPSSILDVATVLRILRKAGNLQRRKESNSDREHILI